MIVSVLLLGFAALAALAGAHLLERSQWLNRSPGWGIWAWQALSGAVASALVLAGLVLAVAATPLHQHIATLLRSCSRALAEHYAAPGGPWTAAAALGASALIVARFGVLAATLAREAAVQRENQRSTLSLVGTRHENGYTVVDHALRLVYCVPGGRRGTIVVTSAAIAALTQSQLDLVLAHERQHLRCRHHLALTLSAALSRTFCGWGVFGMAHERIAGLAEMHADDAVHGSGERRDLARALISLSPGVPRGAAVLASTSGGTNARVRRLAEAPMKARRGRGVAIAALGLAAVATPLALAAAPALESALRDCCPAAIELPPRPTN